MRIIPEIIAAALASQTSTNETFLLSASSAIGCNNHFAVIVTFEPELQTIDGEVTLDTEGFLKIAKIAHNLAPNEDDNGIVAEAGNLRLLLDESGAICHNPEKALQQEKAQAEDLLEIYCSIRYLERLIKCLRKAASSGDNDEVRLAIYSTPSASNLLILEVVSPRTSGSKVTGYYSPEKIERR